jgi:hypothetical protein
MSFFRNTTVNPDAICNSFLDFYYGTISSKGWNGTLSGYDETCICSVNGISNKPFDLVTLFANDGIARGTLINPLATWRYKEDQLHLTVTAGITFISFAGYQVSNKILVDNFIISMSKYKILDHTMHIR